MLKISCEICGSTNLIKTDDVFICQCCECKYSVEEIRKMMMEEKQQQKTLQSKSDQIQGKFGDHQIQSEKETWICTECETINTKNQCVLCGYIHIKEISDSHRAWKRVAAALLATFVLSIGILISMPNGWRESGGEYFYYHKGQKTIGKAEIDGARFYFDKEGAMQTGWQKIADSQYYFGADGRMVTGTRKIDGEIYTFHNDGRLECKKYILNNIPKDRTSDEDTYYIRNDKKTGSGKYQILDQPIENCSKITVTVNISNLKAGNVEDWGFYIRDLEGKWKRCGDIKVVNNTGSATFFFEILPESFDAYVCFCESLESYWEFYFTQALSDIEVIEFY